MKKAKKLFTWILLGVFVVSMYGCGKTAGTSAAEQKEEATTEELKTVRIGVPGLDDNPLLDTGRLAQKLGYFEDKLKDVGYQMELSTFQEAGPAINEAYASEQLDMAVYGDFPATVARSNGNDIKIIGMANSQQNLGILVANDSGITTPKELEGKKVIVGVGTNFQEYWSHVVKEFDIDESKVELVNVVSDSASVFTSGEADAYVTFSYNIVNYANQGLGKKLIDTIAYPEMASQWLITGRTKFLEENPEVAAAVLKAFEEARQYAIEHPQELYEALSSESLGADIYEEVYGFDPAFSYLETEITDANMDKFQYLNQFLLKNEFISEEVDFDEFIDNSYYDLAFGEKE